MAFIFYMSSLSHPPLPSAGSDKFWHAVGYCGLTVMTVRAIAGGFTARIRLVYLVAAVLIAVAYGMSDELHQRFVAGRSSGFDDVLADAVGASVGAAGYWVWSIILSRFDV